MLRVPKKNAQARKKSVKNKPIKVNWGNRYHWSLVVLVMALIGLNQFQFSNLLPVKTIQLAGSFINIDQQGVESMLRGYVGEGFFSLDIQQVRTDLDQQAWIESVSIRRQWPDRLNVDIVEKKPVARWDDEHLISEKGKVFKADVSVFADLPLVHAVNVNPEQVLSQYYTFSKRFESLGEKVVAVRIDGRNAVELDLADNLKIKLGYGSVERRIERLGMIYVQQIKPRRDEIKQLDMRYSNGFAVGWKNEVLKSMDAASIWGNTNV